MVIAPTDRARVAAAVTAAEATSAGEIVTAVAARSDAYHDAALHWAVLVMMAMPATLTLRPDWGARLAERVAGGWTTPPPDAPYLTVLVLCALVFLLARLLLAPMRVRMLLTPGATKTRRVRLQALALFRVGAERRTRGRTGVLIYLSVAERRAEIIADAAIHAAVAEDLWGEAMAVLLDEVRRGRPADGLIAAVERVGAVLAAHFPRAEDDLNELPDRVIEP